VDKRLADLEEAARQKMNLVEPILHAVKEYATIQEICDVLRGVFGEYRSVLKGV
jgi:methylmalonyl-CoA mutase N-terminal domain/subunit